MGFLGQEEREQLSKWVSFCDKKPYNCINTEKGLYITNSKDVFDSQYIHSSIEVSKSSAVCQSSFVQNSCQVFNSEFVDSSSKVLSSSNIEKSSNIVLGTAIFESSNIFIANSILRSRELRNCEDVVDSVFCAACHKIENCLFCADLSEQSFCLFNKPIDPDRYAIIMTQYQKIFSGEPIFVKEWPENPLMSTVPTILARFDKHYELLSEKFWRWVRTLPGYDENILYQLTFLPRFLAV